MSSQPVNLPVDPLQDHDALRKKFEEKADSILDGLESKVRSLMTVMPSVNLAFFSTMSILQGMLI